MAIGERTEVRPQPDLPRVPPNKFGEVSPQRSLKRRDYVAINSPIQ